MHRIKLALIIGCLLSVLPLTAQDTPDYIKDFSTSYYEIGYDALEARTARIPVSWQVENRPLLSNLFFEQVLPDGSRVNIELPRDTVWVASEGEGRTAPILPDGEVEEVVLRVSLRQVFTKTELDAAEVRVPIISGLSGADGTALSDTPSILYFNAEANTVINRADLQRGAVLLPITWSAVNRPTGSNLIFEQILPDGSIVNIELPRAEQWVNSTDSGAVTPIAVGDADELVLRLRLVDMASQTDLDIKTITVPVQDAHAPLISTFQIDPSAPTMAMDELHVTVMWQVENRPVNSNLVFEQILADGRAINAELPRDMIILPDSGEGTLRALMSDNDELMFRVRLIDTSTRMTLTSNSVVIDLSQSN